MKINKIVIYSLITAFLIGLSILWIARNNEPHEPLHPIVGTWRRMHGEYFWYDHYWYYIFNPDGTAIEIRHYGAYFRNWHDYQGAIFISDESGAYWRTRVPPRDRVHRDIEIRFSEYPHNTHVFSWYCSNYFVIRRNP